MRKIANAFALGKSIVSGTINSVSKAIVENLALAMKSQNQQTCLILNMVFPNALGLLMVHTSPPKKLKASASVYINRKGYYSLNYQVVADCKYYSSLSMKTQYHLFFNFFHSYFYYQKAISFYNITRKTVL